MLALVHQDSFREKILFIETQVQMHPERVFVWPVVVGLFYYLIWPGLEIFLTTLRHYIENWRVRAAMWATDREIVPMSEKLEFLKQQRLQIEGLKSTHAEALKREQIVQTQLTQENGYLKSQLDSLVLRELTNGKNPSAEAIRTHLFTNPSRYGGSPDTFPAAKDAMRNLRYRKELRRWLDKAESLTPSGPDQSRIMNSSMIQEVVEAENMPGFVAGMLVLQLLTRTPEPNAYVTPGAVPMGPSPLQKLRRLLDEVPDDEDPTS